MHTSLLLHCALALLESFFRIVDAKCKKNKESSSEIQKFFVLLSFGFSATKQKECLALFAVTRLLLYLCCVGN